MSTATCPLCGETYLAVATVCADCRVALVADPLEDGPLGDGPAEDGPAEDAEVAPADGAAVALEWPDGDEEVGYELDDWGPVERDALTRALLAERIPHEWREDEVVVPERWADIAEELIDVIDHPDALDVEDGDGGDDGAELMSALYVASDILAGDPTSSGAVIELLELAPAVAGASMPYGLDGRTWRSIVEQVASLASLLEADEDEDDVRGVAGVLRGQLRPLV